MSHVGFRHGNASAFVVVVVVVVVNSKGMCTFHSFIHSFILRQMERSFTKKTKNDTTNQHDRTAKRHRGQTGHCVALLYLKMVSYLLTKFYLACV